jgi:hypothetical protein
LDKDSSGGSDDNVPELEPEKLPARTELILLYTNSAPCRSQQPQCQPQAQGPN